MTAIAIERFHARYSVPAAVPGERIRLQRIVTDAVTRVLGGALDRAGLPREGHLCIREVHASARLPLREPDGTLADTIAMTIAGAIAGAADRKPASVVYYHTRAHALVDLAVCVAAGDFERSWAWRQLGVWQGRDRLRPDRAADRVLRSLAGEPRLAVVVLAHLARQHADVLRTLASRTEPEPWAIVARAAAGAFGAPPEWLDDIGVDRPSGDQVLLAASIVGRSAIARALLGQRTDAPAQLCQAVAALAAIEGEPSFFAGSVVRARHTMAALVELLRSPDRWPVTSRRRRDRADGESGVGEAADRGDANAFSPFAEPVQVAPDDRGRSDPARDVDGGLSTDRERTLDRLQPFAETHAPARRYAASRVGGVLYLLTLIDRIPVDVESGFSRTLPIPLDVASGSSRILPIPLDVASGFSRTLLQAIAADPLLAARGLRWVLHRLAMTIADAAPSDPAVLAFAGLGPDADPPSDDEPAPAADERAAIDEYCAFVKRALRDVLGADDDTRDPVAFACRRSAEIAADPGWIDVRFRLDEVSTDIRRAGLDRDPGWLPWLGVVVRFVYA